MRHFKPAVLSLCLSALLIPSTASAQPPARDSVWNGAFIGMAIGTAGPLLVCTSIGDSSETVGCAAGFARFRWTAGPRDWRAHRPCAPAQSQHFAGRHTPELFRYRLRCDSVVNDGARLRYQD